MTSTASAFAPTNIALVKYWGKRDEQLNLPVTGSLSIALPEKGAWTTVSVLDDAKADLIFLNGENVEKNTAFAKRITAFLDKIHPKQKNRPFYQINTTLNIPVAAGVASSAAGFAALTRALDAYHGWGLSTNTLSQLARLGSGSACRSMWPGWVEWQPGILSDGSDCVAEPYENAPWPDLYMGLLLCETSEKAKSSRDAMRISVETSPLYAEWPNQVEADLKEIKQALALRDFRLLGKTAEQNAEAMHACMRAATPSIDYDTAETQAAKQKVRALRQQGNAVFYTQDAGPNLKLLFLSEYSDIIKSAFPTIDIIQPFPIDSAEDVILVDEQDNTLGKAAKMLAHQTGQLHRAFSVFLYRTTASGKKEWLLQQRHAAKYHCGGLWTNSCCSHPRPDEEILDAASRRLKEELGISVPLKSVGNFIYHAEFDNGLTEHELDHVLIGECNADHIQFNPTEIQASRWMTTEAILSAYNSDPTAFTPWFRQAFDFARRIS